MKLQRSTLKKHSKLLTKFLGQNDRRTQQCWWGYLALPAEWRGLDEDLPKEFADDHPIRIVRAYNKASDLIDRGDYQGAEDQQRRALAVFEEKVGPDALWTLACAYDLGLALIELWKAVEAEELFRRVLAGRKKQLHPGHQDILKTMNALGVALWNQKGEKLDEAEDLFQQVLAIRERLGETQDIGYLQTRNNLGLLEFERGDNEAAEKTYRNLLVDREKLQGPDHPETMLCMLSISMALGYQGRYDEAQEAEATIRSVIATRERVLGYDHGNTLKSRGRLSSILEAQGRYDEALAIEEENYSLAVQRLGRGHFETRRHERCLVALKEKMSYRNGDGSDAGM